MRLRAAAAFGGMMGVPGGTTVSCPWLRMAGTVWLPPTR